LIYKNFVPHGDDSVVVRIRDAGAIILGKTNTSEFGYSATTENLLGEDCRNPWDLTRTSGGSSGGAAVGIAAGLTPLAQGSDGGGSIRIPSSMCGVYGIKPTQGRVPRPYQGPGGWGSFAQDGPIARTVRDAALLLQVIAGPDPNDPTIIQEPPPDFSASLEAGVRSLRLGWCPSPGSVPVDPEVRHVTQAAVNVFSEMGATIEDVEMDLEPEHIRNVFTTIFYSDYAANLGGLVVTRGEEMTPIFRAMVEEAMVWPAAKLSLALREWEWHRALMDALIRRYDLLLMPTIATPAFPVGQRPTIIDGRQVDPVWGFTPFTFLVNMSGHPAASLPCGFSSKGLPIGLQVIGHRGDEAMVLRASGAFEQARPWADRYPVVS